MSRRTTPLYLVYAASDLPGVVYRAVSRCPPSVDDFRSYVELGTPHAVHQRFRASGTSVYRNRKALRRQMRRFGLGRAIATIDLRDTDAMWTGSGGTGHLTVWAPADLMFARMLECENDD